MLGAQELLALSLAHSPGAHGADDFEAAIADLVRDGHLIETRRRSVRRAYVTDRTVEAEQEVIRRMRHGLGRAAALADAAQVERALAQAEPPLTAGQQGAVRGILLGTDRTVGVQGYAGTGKTTMLSTALRLCGERRVIGLAPSASAASTLARETQVPTKTLQWFLTRYRDVADNVASAQELAQLREEFAGAVVVVDEMSLVSTVQARDLLRIADRVGIARLVLVGDRRQLRAVDAGQPFRQLQQAGMPTFQMDEVLRQRNPDLKAAVLHAIAGEPGRAIEALGGDLLEVPTEELADTAAHSWLALSAEGRAATAIMAPTHALRRHINETIRAGLADEGVLAGKRWRSIRSSTCASRAPRDVTRATIASVTWRSSMRTSTVIASQQATPAR